MPNQSDPTQPVINPPAPADTSPATPDFQTADIPPMPADNSQIPQVPVVNDQPESPPDLPPIISPPPKKKFGGGKIIATILGFLILVGGLGTGIVLVKQQQDIREKAVEGCIGDDNCTTAAYLCCSQKAYSSSSCTSGWRCDKGGIECTRDGDCLASGPGHSCCSGNDYSDSSCEVTNKRCGEMPLTCDGDCIPNAKTCTNGPGTGTCQGGYHCCKSCLPDGSCTDFKDSCCSNESYHSSECPNLKPEKCGSPESCSEEGKTRTKICTLVCKEPPKDCPGTQTSICENGEWGDYGPCELNNPNCCSVLPTSTPKPTTKPTSTPTYPPGVLGRCVGIKAYDFDWNPLALDTATIKVGDKINFAVKGEEGPGKYDQARFMVNGVEKPEWLTDKPHGNEGFYITYTILKADVGKSINVKAKIHNDVVGWSEY